MYIYHLHSFKQLGQEKYYNGEVIRFLLEDDIHAENNNLDFLDLIYGTASRYDLRSKIYPGFMTYRKWIELSKNYPALILSINFDVHSWKYKNFVKKILGYFPRNKRIIVSAANECYEKRGSAEKVYQTAKEVYQAMQEIGKFYPIAFWNEKIYTSGEKSAVEKLLNDQRVKDICEYFAFQSLGTTNYSVDKYAKMAKQKGFKRGDFELGTETSNFDTIKNKFDLARALGIKDLVVMCPVISINLANYSDIWKKYALAIYYGNNNFSIKNKYKLINYVQQFKSEKEGMKIADDYRLDDKNDRVIDWIQDQLYQRGYLAHPIDFGNFDKKTEQAVKDWQTDQPKIATSGVITKYHIFVLVEQSDNSTKVFRQLMIYAS